MDDKKITETLRKYDKITEQYGLPLDGLLSFGTMFTMYYLDFKPLPTLFTGAIIHGFVHPRIADK